jgi:autotransporter strand-loop-strand O-heptosyltransferase
MKVSIILRTYKRPDFLEECLRSIENQNDDNWEVIIFDDYGSLENMNIVNNFKEKNYNKRVVYLTSKTPFDLFKKSWRYMSLLSEGDVIVRLDDDDLLASDCIEYIRYIYTKYKDLDFSYGSSIFFKNDKLGGLIEGKTPSELKTKSAWAPYTIKGNYPWDSPKTYINNYYKTPREFTSIIHASHLNQLCVYHLYAMRAKSIKDLDLDITSTCVDDLEFISSLEYLGLKHTALKKVLVYIRKHERERVSNSILNNIEEIRFKVDRLRSEDFKSNILKLHDSDLGKVEIDEEEFSSTYKYCTNNENKNMNKLETKSKYIESINSTKINPKKIGNVLINNFIDGPFLEIKGMVEAEYNVEFYDGVDNLSYQTNIKNNMWTKVNKKYFQNWKIKINDDFINYDPTGKKVYISIESKALGDNIAWMPYIEEFRKKWNCNLTVSTFKNELFKNKYKHIEFIEPGKIVNNIYAMYRIGWFYDSNLEPEEPNTIPLQKAATNILGLDFKEMKPDIDFNPSKRPIKEKYVCISPYSTAGLKQWNDKGWNEVIDFLKNKGYSVVNISMDDYRNANVINIDDKDLKETMNWIHHSEFMIGLSSGLSWLSWALNKHVIMISNFSEENHEFTTNCTRIVNKSVCNSCWNNPKFKFDKGDWNWCPVWKGTDKQFECHNSITSRMVIEKINELL